MKHRDGFTLVELMLATVIGAMVVLGVGLPMVSMFKMRLRFAELAAVQGDAMIARNFIIDKVRLEKNGPGYLAIEEVSGVKRLRLGESGVGDYIYKSGGKLIFDPSSGDDVVLVDSGVNEFFVELRSSPAFHVVCYLEVKRGSSEVRREFVACGRNQAGDDS